MRLETVPDEELWFADKWVRVLADSCAEGVWEKGGGACPVDMLPVPAAVAERLRAWQAWYDRDEDDWGLFRGNVAAFAAEGLDVARAVKAALPDWTIIYCDAAAYERSAKDARHDSYEYEITG